MSFVIPTITNFDKGTLKAADVISCTAWDKDNGAGSCDDAASFAWGGPVEVCGTPLNTTNAPRCTATAWIFIPAYCFAVP